MRRGCCGRYPRISVRSSRVQTICHRLCRWRYAEGLRPCLSTFVQTGFCPTRVGKSDSTQSLRRGSIYKSVANRYCRRKLEGNSRLQEVCHRLCRWEYAGGLPACLGTFVQGGFCPTRVGKSDSTQSLRRGSIYKSVANRYC